LDNNNYKDYYVSDQQKEALFKASAHDEESEAWNEEVYYEIDNKIYEKKEGYFNWFKQFLMINNFSCSLICDSTDDMLEKAYFTDNAEEEAKIVEMIKLNIQQTNEEEPNHEYNFNYSEEEFNEKYGYLTRKIKPPQQEGLIKNFFDQYNFTKKELVQIIDIANKKLAQLV
jgi:hypothetical protein